MFKQDPKIIILMGLSGAGKGTQAKFLQKKFDIPHLSTGDMLRAKSQEEDELGRKIKHINDTFSPMPDEIVIDMIKDRILKPDCINGFILDGFPRTLSQAKALDEMLDQQGLEIGKVILFEMEDKDVIERLSGRLNCSSCKSSYHAVHMPPKLENFCDNCHVELYIRDDDTPEKIKIRLDVFKQSMQPLIPYYQQKNILQSIDAMASIGNVTKEIAKILQE